MAVFVEVTAPRAQPVAEQCLLCYRACARTYMASALKGSVLADRLGELCASACWVLVDTLAHD